MSLNLHSVHYRHTKTHSEEKSGEIMVWWPNHQTSGIRHYRPSQLIRAAGSLFTNFRSFLSFCAYWTELQVLDTEFVQIKWLHVTHFGCIIKVKLMHLCIEEWSQVCKSPGFICIFSLCIMSEFNLLLL